MNNVIEINVIALAAYLLIAFTLGWIYSEYVKGAELRRLNAENNMLWQQVLPDSNVTILDVDAEVTRLQPHRGASRDRSVPGKARVKARKAANRVG